MKVLKKIWKGIRFGIGILFTIPFLISLFCMYLFGITVAIFDYSIINKIAEKFSIVNDKVETAVDSIATIISAEKFNSKRRKKIILNICESEKLKHD